MIFLAARARKSRRKPHDHSTAPHCLPARSLFLCIPTRGPGGNKGASMRQGCRAHPLTLPALPAAPNRGCGGGRAHWNSAATGLSACDFTDLSMLEQRQAGSRPYKSHLPCNGAIGQHVKPLNGARARAWRCPTRRAGGGAQAAPAHTEPASAGVLVDIASTACTAS
jgi:hypothetical protein